MDHENNIRLYVVLIFFALTYKISVMYREFQENRFFYTNILIYFVILHHYTAKLYVCQRKSLRLISNIIVFQLEQYQYVNNKNDLSRQSGNIWHQLVSRLVAKLQILDTKILGNFILQIGLISLYCHTLSQYCTEDIAQMILSRIFHRSTTTSKKSNKQKQ